MLGLMMSLLPVLLTSPSLNGCTVANVHNPSFVSNWPSVPSEIFSHTSG
jgi:hypothetical protein